jgi:hypothetical protein
MKQKMTSLQAFKAMICFLDDYYHKTLSDDLGSLLGDIQLLEDDTGTWDSAAWSDWDIALEGKKSVTPMEGFKGMFNFLDAYYKRTARSSDDIAFILSGTNMDPAFFQDWVRCVDDQ